jgi:hypothetical protein
MSTKSKSPTVYNKTRASKDARSNRLAVPKDRLWQQMSEVISLRERLAQAELAARRDNPPIKEEAKNTSTSRPDRQNRRFRGGGVGAH